MSCVHISIYNVLLLTYTIMKSFSTLLTYLCGKQSGATAYSSHSVSDQAKRISTTISIIDTTFMDAYKRVSKDFDHSYQTRIDNYNAKRVVHIQKI